MIIMVTTVRAHPNRAQDYEAKFRDLREQVLEREPGTIFYNVGKCRDEPLTYRAIEIFRDEEAMAAHLNAEWLAAAWPSMHECLAEVDVVLHDTIVP